MKDHRSKRKLPEGEYIPQARRALTARRLRQKAAEEEQAALRATAKLMHDNHMQKFDFKDENGVVHRAKLVRPKKKEVSVLHFHTMMQNHEITLTDFLEAISVDMEKARDLLDDRLPSVLQTVKGPLTLKIAPFTGG